MEPLTTSLASHGVLGIICALLIYWVKRLTEARDADAKSYNVELQKATDGRLADAKAYTDKVLEIQRTVIDAVNKLSELYEMEQQNRTRPRGRFPSSSGGP